MAAALTPFEVLFDEVEVGGAVGLSADLAAVYGSDLTFPVLADRPYVASNFVVARDGRVSFSMPGHAGGGDVSGFNAHDTWLMAVLRGRADAVMVGDGTLRIEPEHIWSHQFIAPSAAVAESVTAWRSARTSTACPLLVVVSATGAIETEATVMAETSISMIVATPTGAPAEQARRRLGSRPNSEVIATGNGLVDLHELLRNLKRDRGVDFLLCEGGPGLYGTMLAQGAVDDEFLTLSPLVVGSGTNDARRPSLVEGATFSPGATPVSVPVSMRRAGAHLFLRSRYRAATDAQGAGHSV